MKSEADPTSQYLYGRLTIYIRTLSKKKKDNTYAPKGGINSADTLFHSSWGHLQASHSSSSPDVLTSSWLTALLDSLPSSATPYQIAAFGPHNLKPLSNHLIDKVNSDVKVH